MRAPTADELDDVDDIDALTIARLVSHGWRPELHRMGVVPTKRGWMAVVRASEFALSWYPLDQHDVAAMACERLEAEHRARAQRAEEERQAWCERAAAERERERLRERHEAARQKRRANRRPDPEVPWSPRLAAISEAVLEEPAPPADDLVFAREIAAIVCEVLTSLTPRQREATERYFGLNGRAEQTLEEAGEDMGVGKEAVRVMREAALFRVRRYLAKLEVSPQAAARRRRAPLGAGARH